MLMCLLSTTMAEPPFKPLMIGYLTHIIESLYMTSPIILKLSDAQLDGELKVEEELEEAVVIMDGGFRLVKLEVRSLMLSRPKWHIFNHDGAAQNPVPQLTLEQILCILSP